MTRYNPRKTFHLMHLIPVVLALLASYGPATNSHASTLKADYDQALLAAGSSSLPFIVQSTIREDQLAARIYSMIDQRYADMSSAFTELENWCDFLPLHLNVKACTFYHSDKKKYLALYLGRKFYQSPEDSYKLVYQFNIEQKDPHGFTISLKANEGPLDTADYRMQLEAEPLDHQTLVRISLSYTPSWISELATETYLATLGRNKVGFSIIGKNSQAEAVFIDGINAIIERNVMRYYLAMQAYAETRSLTGDKAFEARIKRWFELTELYARQLRELEQESYLQAKRQERRNQKKLQSELTGNQAAD